MGKYLHDCQEQLGLLTAPLTPEELENAQSLIELLRTIPDIQAYVSILRDGPSISFGKEVGIPVFALSRRKNSPPNNRLIFGFRTQDKTFINEVTQSGMDFKQRFELSMIRDNPIKIIEFIEQAIQMTVVKKRLGLENDAQRIKEAFVLVRSRSTPQAIFKGRLIETFDKTCPVTGCTTKQLLDGAHIIPVAIENNYDLENGLLLRTDIHRLFDTKLLAFEVSGTRVTVNLDKSIRYDTSYNVYHGKILELPTSNIMKRLARLKQRATLQCSTDALYDMN
ncbi:HNH endonuclease [Yersinia enterocolitica]|nr:HNH endonuclease [Yersinia enterocolitica]EKN3831221.1 HNH endonuclease [Yersinia enterocolitica]